MIVCTFVGVQDCVGASSLARDRPKSHEHWSLTSKDVSSVMCLIDSLWLSVYCISMKKTLFWTSKLYWKATEYRAIFSPSLHAHSQFPFFTRSKFLACGFVGGSMNGCATRRVSVVTIEIQTKPLFWSKRIFWNLFIIALASSKQ